MRRLLPRLPEVLAGKAKPTSPAEACDFAPLCIQPFQKRYAAAVRLFDAAFAADPQLAGDLAAGHRYQAACSAALAARGDRADAPNGMHERKTLRTRALAWLQADLAQCRQQAVSTEALRRPTADMLSQWLHDPDLAELRPGSGRGMLPADERSAWDTLWANVRATLALIRKRLAATPKK
jgi:hypothetical protein